MKARFDTFELSAETAKRKESSGLEEMKREDVTVALLLEAT